VRRTSNWLDWVNEGLTAAELDAVRRCVNRGAPYGSAPWVAKAAEEMGLESALRPRGRPRKQPRSAPGSAK